MTSNSDMDLVAASLSGNRDAFGHIVSRYQNLICSLAYSATGNLSQSEDLAQETFFTAWKQLADLREPPKLRAWLCGIARNLIHNSLRRQGREPVHHAEELATVDESPAPERAPLEHAISNEEQAILWRSLERIPEIYREPLVLFYRQHQSIEAVAQSLELSEDAVKQRLSRGRKLLQEEVAAFVEGALRQSAPGQAFAGTVLSALPLKTGVMAVAGAGAAKSAGPFSFLTLPLIGFFGSVFGSVWVVRNAKTSDQRRTLKRAMAAIWLSVVCVIVAQNVAVYLRNHLGWTERTYVMVEVGNYWLFSLVLVGCQVMFFNHYRRARLQSSLASETELRTMRANETSENNLFSGMGGMLAWAGMMIGGLAWLVNMAWHAGDYLAMGIVTAVAVVAIAWPACMSVTMGAIQAKKSLLSFVPSILMFGVIFLMLNWRLDLWIAQGKGITLDEAHQILPMWIIHAGTALLLACVGMLIAATKPKPAAGV